MSEKFAVRGAVHLVNDLVVALPHLGLVRQRLSDPRLRAGRGAGRQPGPGLALLELTGPGAAGGTAATTGSPARPAPRRPARPLQRPATTAGCRCSARTVRCETVGGTHVISGGGSELPAPTVAEAEALVGGWDDRSLARTPT